MIEAVSKIAEILNITFEEHTYEPTPQNACVIFRGNIDRLKLDQVTIENVDALLPFLPKLRELTLTNSTVSNISELIKLQTWRLNLDNVAFNNEAYDETVLDGFELRDTPNYVRIENTRLNVCALKDYKELKSLFIKDSHVSNIYALCNYPTLYQVNLTHITFEESEEYEIQNGDEDHSFMLTVEDCKIKKRNFFRPFGAHIFSLRIYYSRLQNIDDLSQFPNLGSFSIDASTTIKQLDSYGATNEGVPEHFLNCEFIGGSKRNSLSKLAPIAAYFKGLSLTDCNTKTLEGVELFTRVTHLWFENSKVHLKTFLPIAHQIKFVDFEDSTLKAAHLWSHFTAIDTFKVLSFRDNKKGLKTLKNILPLRHQIKRLRLMEELKDLENIEQFSSLEVLDTHIVPFKIVRKILSLTTLKKLSISIWPKKKRILNIGNLTLLEHLQVNGSEDVQVEGVERLNRLESLEIEKCFVDVNQLPLMPNLKRLALALDDYHVDGLAHFPNLEKLKILSVKSIRLEKLHQLKVLDLSNCIYVESFNFFEDLPRLETLSLSDLNNDPEGNLIQLEALKQLANLKRLCLKETTLKSLDGIEALQSLEYLDLNDTGVRDVKVLNSLKNLREVYLVVSQQVDSLEMKHQLERPEIAKFINGYNGYFRIWEDVNLWED